MKPTDKALEILARISGREATEIDRDMDLVGDLNLDSPHALQLLVELEEALGIEIGDEEAARMDRVGDVLDFVEGAAARA